MTDFLALFLPAVSALLAAGFVLWLFAVRRGARRRLKGSADQWRRRDADRG
jgi:hypothetical protein